MEMAMSQPCHPPLWCEVMQENMCEHVSQMLTMGAELHLLQID